MTKLCYTQLMAAKDIISKHIVKRLIEDISRYLFHLKLKSLEVLETQYQHIEIQNDNDDIMLQRMLRYRTDISLQFPNFEIEQYLIYIGKERA